MDNRGVPIVVYLVIGLLTNRLATEQSTRFEIMNDTRLVAATVVAVVALSGFTVFSIYVLQMTAADDMCVRNKASLPSE
jgi:hypothetical protein